MRIPVQPVASLDRGVLVEVQPVPAIAATRAPTAFAAISAGQPAPAAQAAQVPANAAAGTAAAAAAAPATGAQAAAAAQVVHGEDDPSRSPALSQFLDMIRGNSTEFEAQGRVLRLRQFLRGDVPPQVRQRGLL